MNSKQRRKVRRSRQRAVRARLRSQVEQLVRNNWDGTFAGDFRQALVDGLKRIAEQEQLWYDDVRVERDGNDPHVVRVCVARKPLVRISGTVRV